MNPHEPSDKRPLGARELQQHETWLRRLVRGLGADVDPEDVMQATWLAALQDPPRERGSLRSWLAAVARNFVHRERRSAQRRRDREERAARPESQEPTDEVVAELQRRRAVMAALEALDEPYRSTLYWRFLERHSVAQIAARSRITESAVRSRTHRGLEQLRRALGITGGPRALAWFFGLPGAAWRRVSLLASGVLPMLVSTPKLALGLCVATGIAGLVLLNPFRSDPAPEIPGGDAPSLPGAVVAELPEPDTSPAPGYAPERRARIHDAPATTPVARQRFQGRVLDSAGRPCSGVPVLLRVRGAGEELATAAEAMSDVGGAFELELPESANGELLPGAKLVAGAGYFTLRAWPLGRLQPDDATKSEGARDSFARTVIVARRVDLRARVLDPSGEALPGARLQVLASELRTFPASLPQHLRFEGIVTRADAEGRLQLEVPADRNAILRVTHDGFAPWTQPCPTQPCPELGIELQPHAEGPLTGIVVGRQGLPVADVEVRFLRVPGASAHTDAEGRFSLPWPSGRPNRSFELVAWAPGRLPAVRKGLRADAWIRAGAEPIRLELGGETLALHGSVRHEGGRPARGYRVALRGARMLYGRQPLRSLEQLLADEEALDPLERCPVGEDGSFVVTGLLPERSYVVVAFDPVSLVAITSRECRAGEGPLQIVVPRDAVRERLRGRILSLAGRPLAGVEVRVLVQMFPSPDAQLRGKMRAITDERGRFELRGVPRRGIAWLHVRGEAVIPMAHPVTEFATHEEVDLRTDARCRVRFLEGQPRVPGATVYFLDEAGKPVPLWTFTKNAMLPRNFTVLDGEASAEFAISERATTLVYAKEGDVRLRRSLQLVPGQRNPITP